MKLLIVALGGLILGAAAHASHERASVSSGWPWLAREASITQLREFAEAVTSEAKPLDDDEVISLWTSLSRRFGVSFSMNPGGPGVGETRYYLQPHLVGYSVDAHEASPDGWRVQHLHADLDPATRKPGQLWTDEEGFWIPADAPSIWFIQNKRWQREVPAEAELKKTVVAIGNGKGRLVLVDLSGEKGVAVLPYGVK